jgi:hypothetical protein
MSDYYAKGTKAPPRRPVTPTETPEWEPSFPLPDIGDTIRVEGKVRPKFEERIVLVDKLGMYSSGITRFCCLIVSSTDRATFDQRRASALARSCRIPRNKVLSTLCRP